MFKITVKFEDKKGKTIMTLRHDNGQDERMQKMAEMGWNQSLDKMEKIFAKA